MMDTPAYPGLLQLNTRVWLRALSERLGRRVTLAEVPDEVLDRLADKAFDWVWLLSVWQTGAAGRAISRSHSGWREEFRRTLPDLAEDDICGSGFAVTGYATAETLGGDAALADLRRRLAERGLKLMLDFVPNHVAPDHPWLLTHPDFFVAGSEDDLARAPQNWVRVQTGEGERILAYGRDAHVSGWPDTLQLSYGNPALREAMVGELLDIAQRCDGVRCDMAMLVTPEAFARTWGIAMPPFWPEAIARVKAARPDFVFMAEVYWDMEWELQQQGFDFCYDKRLYDRLVGDTAGAVRQHLAADRGYQSRLVRFLENHDEPRAAATFPFARHRAAAVITYLSPGLRFVYQGQVEGARVHVPPHLCRGPDEPVDGEIAAFYGRLLKVLSDDVVRNGTWWQLDPEAAGDGNAGLDAFVACLWEHEGDCRLVAVNFSDGQAQCRLRLPLASLAGHRVRLSDLLGDEVHDHDGDELLSPGLFLDHPPWHAVVFAIGPAA